MIVCACCDDVLQAANRSRKRKEPEEMLEAAGPAIAQALGPMNETLKLLTQQMSAPAAAASGGAGGAAGGGAEPSIDDKLKAAQMLFTAGAYSLGHFTKVVTDLTGIELPDCMPGGPH